MAIDVAVIGVEYRTDGINKGTKALRDNEQQANKTADSADKLSDKSKKASLGFESLSRAVSVAAGALVGIGAGTLISQYTRLADTVTMMDARLRLAVKGSEEFAQSQRDIESIARKTNAGLVETTTLYTKLNDPVRALGGGIKEVSGITEAFAQTLRVSGASQAESASATLQFAQAMASGALRGDEFNSIAEANPRFMKAMAAGMGVSVGSLREMAAAGRLTADVVGNALIGQLENLRKEGAQIPLTVGAAMQGLSNTTLKLIGEFDKMTGGSGALADMLVKYVTPALKSVYSVAVGVQQVFSTLGLGIGGTLAAIAAVLRGEFGQAREIMAEMTSDIATNWERAGASISSVWDAAGDSAGYAASEMGKLAAAIRKAEKATKAVKDQAQRYLETLQRQLDKTRELTVEEQTLAEIQSGRIGKVSAAMKKQILATARLIDLQRAEKDSIKASEQAATDAASAAGRLVEESMRYAREVEEPFEKLQRQIKELEIAVESNPLIDAETAARLGTKYWQEYLSSLENVNKELNQFDDFSKRAAQNIQDSIGAGLADLMEGNFKNIGDSFTKMINRMVAEAAAAQLSRYLFGNMAQGGSGSGGLLSSLVSAGVSYFLGAPASGSLTTGDFSRMDRLIPSANGNAFGPSGVIPFANGGIVNEPTLFKFSQGTGLMGEAGQEAIMPLKRGPDGKLGVSGSGQQVVVNNNFTISGPTDRRTQMQIAAAAASGAQRGMARNT